MLQNLAIRQQKLKKIDGNSLLFKRCEQFSTKKTRHNTVGYSNVEVSREPFHHLNFRKLLVAPLSFLFGTLFISNELSETHYS